MMALGLLLSVMLIGRVFPATPVGAWCHAITTRRFVVWIGRIERRHILLLLIGLVLYQGFAMAMPLDWALVATLDAATYVDLLLALAALGAVRHCVGMGKRCACALRRRARPAVRPRRRARRVRPPAVGADDPDAPARYAA